MAFLCPVSFSRRGKKKKTLNSSDSDKDSSAQIRSDLSGLGRITGSSSIETLVRVGIEKEHGLSPDSKMVVLYDFTPCVDDELEVKRGQIVNILYRENDWVYVIGQDSRQEGFIPHSYCAPYNTQLAELAVKKKLPRDISLPSDLNLSDGGVDLVQNDLMPDENTSGLIGMQVASLKHSQASLSSEPDFLPFAKDPSGRYIVLYTFIARDENDVSVERGEFVTVLNREDVDWFWIVRSDGQEGFIPSGFVYPAENLLQSHAKNNNNVSSNNLSSVMQQMCSVGLGTGGNVLATTATTTTSMSQPPLPLATNNNPVNGSDDLRQHTEFVMLYDWKAQSDDDLSVRRGDWIYADLNNQTVEGWLWAYSPKTRKYGFIPKAYARPPAMTSL